MSQADPYIAVPAIRFLLLLGAAAMVFDAPARAADAESVHAESALLKVAEEVTVPARASGVLASFVIEEGAKIEQGALLAEVDKTESEMMLRRAKIEFDLASKEAESDIATRSAETKVDFARSEYTRMKRAAEELPGSVSRSEVEESRMNAKQAELDLEQAKQDHEIDLLTARLKQTEVAIAEQRLGIHRVVAPIDGVLVETLRRAGEWVEPGDEVARITRTDRLRVEGLVPLEAATRGLLDARATVMTRLGGQEITAEGRVTFVNPQVNPVSKKVLVRAEFENPGGRLIPGMRVEFTITPPESPPGE